MNVSFTGVEKVYTTSSLNQKTGESQEKAVFYLNDVGDNDMSKLKPFLKRFHSENNDNRTVFECKTVNHEGLLRDKFLLNGKELNMRSKISPKFLLYNVLSQIEEGKTDIFAFKTIIESQTNFSETEKFTGKVLYRLQMQNITSIMKSKLGDAILNLKLHI